MSLKIHQHTIDKRIPQDETVGDIIGSYGYLRFRSCLLSNRFLRVAISNGWGCHLSVIETVGTHLRKTSAHQVDQLLEVTFNYSSHVALTSIVVFSLQ